MAIKKNAKNSGGMTPLMEALADDDLSGRIETISEQTGLSLKKLLQKWLLQEEQMVGIIRRCEQDLQENILKHIGTLSDILRQQAFDVPLEFADENYKKTLVGRIRKLREEGRKTSSASKAAG